MKEITKIVNKKMKSLIYFIKLKWYFYIVKYEMWSMCLKGEMIPENFFWQRLDIYLSENGGDNVRKKKKND